MVFSGFPQMQHSVHSIPVSQQPPWSIGRRNWWNLPPFILWGAPRVALSCGSSSNIWPQLLDLLFSGRRGPSSFSWDLPSCQHSSSHPLLCPCHFKSKDLELNTLPLSSLSGRKQTPSGHPSFINLVKYSVGLHFKSRAAHCWFTSKVK